MKRPLLIESQILPPVVVIYKMTAHNEVVIEAHENYQKRSFRNRIYLSGHQGMSHFTIPLSKGKHEKQNIQDVTIAYDENWIDQLERVLKTCYSSAPFFIYYIQDLLDLFRTKPKHLFDLNQSLLEWVIDVLKLEIVVTPSPSYGSGTDIEDLRAHYLPKNRATSYPIVKYRQVYEDKNGFIPNLSILDMMMCCGPEIPLYFADKNQKL